MRVCGRLSHRARAITRDEPLPNDQARRQFSRFGYFGRQLQLPMFFKKSTASSLAISNSARTKAASSIRPELQVCQRSPVHPP